MFSILFAACCCAQSIMWFVWLLCRWGQRWVQGLLGGNQASPVFYGRVRLPDSVGAEPGKPLRTHFHAGSMKPNPISCCSRINFSLGRCSLPATVSTSMPRNTRQVVGPSVFSGASVTPRETLVPSGNERSVMSLHCPWQIPPGHTRRLDADPVCTSHRHGHTGTT